MPNLVVVKVGAGGAVNMLQQRRVRPRRSPTWPAGTATTAAGGSGHGLVPARILDTRTGIGAPAAPSSAPAPTLELQVTGRGGVPATGVSAVVLNVTVTEPAATAC